jgi:transcriptional regulator with PAS, ATPase and Fis domain
LDKVHKVQEYFLPKISEEELQTKYKKQALLGKSDAFVQLLKAVDAAAACDVRVLLEGESGTGKELIARAVHNVSSRKNSPFVAVDCAAIPENLMESELFGHVKGAFTGASKDQKGLFLEANHGTLFLDEITNLPLELQGKLLRVLQEKEIRPLGSHRTISIDVRVISASSVPLSNLVDKHNFREELFYRLHVYPISIPSLEQRRDDIPLLANHFLKKFSQQQGKSIKTFDASIINFMCHRSWKGNIRELENFVERMVTIANKKTTVLDTILLPQEFYREYENLKYKLSAKGSELSLSSKLQLYEKELIQNALSDSNWNKSQAARLLKISEGTIRQKMKKLDLHKPV